ncbi:DUF4239 domain-containing protein [Nocardiopsis ansamitocini]|uniref:DUF4239 domain-containing protein n=1 Tax=Nocardiopsis ansamitocini TaxID=1670832 RepID=A0A9W6UKX2_9ACTN|nr:DUF4239 domain-containing protein [Nocardiopsis ansamitocini]GLU49505.1 hypothetical protein Nans01_38560 [Nocardiopsis ansamitocini]
MEFVLITVAVALLALGGFFAVRRYAISDDDCGGPIGSFVAPGVLAIYLVAVAMAIVIGWENNSAAQDLSVRESAAATDLYWSTGAMPEEEGERVRAALRDYLGSVIEDDWPLMAAGAMSDVAEERLGELRMSVGAITADDQSAVMDRMLAHQETASLIELRIDRGDTAGPNIPTLLLLASVVSAVAVIVMPFAMGVKGSPTRRFWAIVNLALVAGSVLVLFFIDNPYAGLLALDPGSVEDTLAGFDRIDQIFAGV